MAHSIDTGAQLAVETTLMPASASGYGRMDPLSACAVEEWVRRGSMLPVEYVPVGSIRNSYTPRRVKADHNHVQVLAQSPLPLPPIVIHRESMRVIDGVHRLRATELRGQNTIAARLFDGNDAEAFALAVHLNVTHGLPLTLAERKSAAQRVLAYYPHWSDRSIGLITGISNKTVGKLRACSTEENSQLNPRLGRDGKLRPVSPARGRRRAAEFLSVNPTASLREVAQQAGVSVTTARDVRQRVGSGKSPLPEQLAKAVAERVPAVKLTGPAHAASPAQPRGRDPLQLLRDDPSIWSLERGRELMRLLSAAVSAVNACRDFADSAPPHSVPNFAEVARGNARAWQEVAAALDAKIR